MSNYGSLVLEKIGIVFFLADSMPASTHKEYNVANNFIQCE